MGRPEGRSAAALLAALQLATSASLARAETKPVFMPGLYDSESRSAAMPGRGTRKTECLASVDAAAFQRDTLARFGALPQFKAVCKLSAAKPLPDGFAFAMDCGTAKTIVTYHLANDLVRSVVETNVASRPEKGSTVLTLFRRVGNCR